MEKFLVKKDSWHFRLFALYRALTDADSYFWSQKTYVEHIYDEQVRNKRSSSSGKSVFRDFCTYWRNVLLWPGLNLVVNIVLTAAIAGVIANIPMLGNITLALLIFTVIATFVVGIIFGASCLIVLLVEKAVNNRAAKVEGQKEKKPTTFFGKMYDDYKNKYCTIIEVEDK